ncbi:SDR family oxidoreductase [Janthinobacterium lividum]|uniref:SDR family oxidoreductase n=1 Tax=Janthinobacterium lividum TaxID=29581 RepID=UPI0008747F66|nr:SDR family oxidoreductase [Janthinobacterium lividum]MCC7716621.1 SDR family oxidoreductase [Janthinobacterium lividum]OEZ63456.1 quinone oxidoreductase 2 [Janthinobacterium lividum]WQE30915.1 SDR family oxidoreductase [Janthinobacterium lividum]STQ96437.1 Quinone oxidoreductase 2 [Janthinobacterium lividum]
MIVITGATGNLGEHVIASLLTSVPAANIIAAVRNPAKAAGLVAQGVQVRQADYNDGASLDAAFKGATKILLISSSEVGQRAQQHQNVIDAAKRAGVALLAYTSVLRADTSPLGLAAEHVITEAAIRASGLPYSFLRNGWYLENHTEHLVPVLEHGVVLGAAQNGRFSSAARLDYAAAAAAVLTAPQPQAIYELAGDHGFTLAEYAAEVARQSGKAIAYKDMPQADFKAALVSVGVPEGFADLLADSDAGAAKGGLEDNGKQLSALIGRPTTSLFDAVKAALAK